MKHRPTLDRWEHLAALGVGHGFGDELLEIGGLKGFVDGLMGNSSARFYEPYLHSGERDRWRQMMQPEGNMERRLRALTPPVTGRKSTPSATRRSITYSIFTPGSKPSTRLANAGGWFPEERIDLETALRAYTVNNAWAAGDETIKGSLEVGKLANLVVLDRDPFAVQPGEIKDL